MQNGKCGKRPVTSQAPSRRQPRELIFFHRQLGLHEVSKELVKGLDVVDTFAIIREEGREISKVLPVRPYLPKRAAAP